MEALFGVVGKDFVLLGADCKAARSILVYKDDENKMMALDSHKVAVGNGPQSDRCEFFEYVQKNIKLYELRNGISLDGPATANFMRTELATYLRKAPKQVNVLLGSVDTGKDGNIMPHLFWMDYMASMVNVNFGAHGYGANFCLSIFDRHWKPDMTLDECMKIMNMCLRELEERFLVKSGQWKFQVIDANGIRTVST